MFEILRHRKARRLNLGELARLDPHLLADIGVTRAPDVTDNLETVLLLRHGPFERPAR
jgi:hypothetical protein